MFLSTITSHFFMRAPPRAFKADPFSYHQEIELTIDTLTNQGVGLGRVDITSVATGEPAEEKKWVVMVPFSLPGETVRARVFRNHKNYSEADLVAVLTPSAERVTPRCELFGQCGGCQYQHLDYAAQKNWKTRQVSELLLHLAGLTFPVLPVIGSPREYAYRSKITPHFHRPKDSQLGDIGFLRQGTRSQMVDVPQCAIATEAVNAALATVRAEARKNAQNFRHGATLLLREDANGNVCTQPKHTAIERVGSLEFEFLAGDFFQNNPFILPEFVDYSVRQARGQDDCTYLVDAYCGSGLFALAAAKHFSEVVGVEISETAVARAARNAERNQLTNARFLAASAEAIFAEVAFPADQTAILIDPPRAGCSEEFLAQLVTFSPLRIVYISCNPATQMRDLRTLTSAGYVLREIQPFDLFPQTKHLECVITLDRP
jgi:tRNA/tmRNA/rRNA uracil-C5-methylase (TrmA/RlmC/RlmD family)